MAITKGNRVYLDLAVQVVVGGTLQPPAVAEIVAEAA
jgi:hypothetical protein